MGCVYMIMGKMCIIYISLSLSHIQHIRKIEFGSRSSRTVEKITDFLKKDN